MLYHVTAEFTGPSPIAQQSSTPHKAAELVAAIENSLPEGMFSLPASKSDRWVIDFAVLASSLRECFDRAGEKVERMVTDFALTDTDIARNLVALRCSLVDMPETQQMLADRTES
jgi:hypothetical protein